VTGRRAPRWLLLALLAGAAGVVGAAQDDLPIHRECGYCGMDRKAYGFSRMLVRYEDGAEAGTCSLRCTLVELDAHPGKAVKAVLAADRDTHALVDAASATWVVGGRKRGVMTARAKWAFATPAGAEGFVKAHGGTLATWDEARAAAREDLARDLAAEQAERRARPFGCAGPAAASASP
jgi:nitrous oxide reductase accessory protein NosL